MADNKHFELFVVSLFDELVYFLLVERADELEQAEEKGSAVCEVFGCHVRFLGPHCLDVEADELAVFSVVVFFEDANLVEGTAEVNGPEGFVLVEFQAVLVVKVDAEELVVSQRESHFVGGVKICKDDMGGLNVDADPFGVVGHIAEGYGVAGGGDVCLVHRLVGFRLDGDFDFPVVVEYVIQRVGEPLDGELAILRFADVRAFAGEPENGELCFERVADIDGSPCAVFGILSAGRVVGGKCAVDGLRVFPEPRRGELGDEAFVVEHLLDLSGLLDNLVGAHIVHAGHGVVVVELDTVETEFFVFLKFLGEFD